MACSCDRCETTVEQYDSDTAQRVRLTEISTNFGLLALLCLNCRRSWTRHMNQSTLFREYSEISFRLEHWRISHRKTGQADVNVGLGFLRDLTSLDDKLLTESVNWIKSGLSADERRLRELSTDDD